MKRFFTLLCICVVIHAAEASDPFDVNLLVNPGAESDGLSNVQTGWTPIVGDASVYKYVLPFGNSANYLDTNDPGPSDRGTNYFWGGTSFNSIMMQQVTIPDTYTNYTDQGRLNCQLSGWLGGYINDGDYATITAVLLDKDYNTLTNLSIGPVTHFDRNDLTGLQFRSTEGDVPAGTRFARVLVEFFLFQGQNNDGYADNISLEFTPTTRITYFSKTNEVYYFTVDNLFTVTTNAIDYQTDMTSNTWTHLTDFVATNATINITATNNTPPSNLFFRISCNFQPNE